jgi:hypothetical protein
MDDLSDQERQEAGAAFADAHSWASAAWRALGRPETGRADVLADAGLIAERLAQLCKDLGAENG